MSEKELPQTKLLGLFPPFIPPTGARPGGLTCVVLHPRVGLLQGVHGGRGALGWREQSRGRQVGTGASAGLRYKRRGSECPGSPDIGKT